MAKVPTRTLLAACLLTLLVAGCGGGEDTDGPQARPTLTDPAAVPTAVPDEEREPYQIGQGSVNAPGDPVPVAPAPEQSATRTYVVQEGDTCGEIAADHGISIDALLDANPRINEDCTNLHVGETLNVPAPDPNAPTPTSSSSGTSSSGRTYIVLAGDTCAAIADDHAIPLQTLLVANGLDEESCQTLQVGQEVIIPE